MLTEVEEKPQNILISTNHHRAHEHRVVGVVGLIKSL